MSYPTQSGDVLTAATLNTFPLVRLFEGGLTGTSYSVTNVFSSTYDAYRVICSPLGTNTTSNSPTVNLRFIYSAGDDNRSIYTFSQYGHYNATQFDGGASGQTSMELTTISYTSHGHLTFDAFQPNLTAVTTVSGSAAGFQNNISAYATRGSTGGCVASLENYTGFTLFLGTTDTFTGTIRVYGYNQA